MNIVPTVKAPKSGEYWTVSYDAEWQAQACLDNYFLMALRIAMSGLIDNAYGRPYIYRALRAQNNIITYGNNVVGYLYEIYYSRKANT